MGGRRERTKETPLGTVDIRVGDANGVFERGLDWC